jgi:hypothetical protein
VSRAVAIVRRGKVWQVQVRVGKDPRTGRWVRRSATADTEAEARQVERRLLAEAEHNRAAFVEPTGETVADYLARWLGAKREDLRPSTWTTYESLTRGHIVPALGTVRLMDLSPAKVQALIDALRGAPANAR